MTTIRRPAVIAASALSLFAIAFAAVTGASFTSTGNQADSMAMAVMTGIALLCYAANLYLLPRSAWRARPGALPGWRRHHRGREVTGLMGG